MQSDDFKWFLDNYNALYKKYGRSFLAIKDHTVLGVYKTYAEGVNATKQTENLGTFIVQECNGDETAYTNYMSSVNYLD